MSPKLPVISELECIKALENIGYKRVRQKGSHIRLKTMNDKLSSVTVPHKELRPGLLKKILNDAENIELEVEEFIKLL